MMPTFVLDDEMCENFAYRLGQEGQSSEQSLPEAERNSPLLGGAPLRQPLALGRFGLGSNFIQRTCRGRKSLNSQGSNSRRPASYS